MMTFRDEISIIVKKSKNESSEMDFSRGTVAEKSTHEVKSSRPTWIRYYRLFVSRAATIPMWHTRDMRQ